jgi:hypothetical protein
MKISNYFLISILLIIFIPLVSVKVRAGECFLTPPLGKPCDCYSGNENGMRQPPWPDNIPAYNGRFDESVTRINDPDDPDCTERTYITYGPYEEGDPNRVATTEYQKSSWEGDVFTFENSFDYTFYGPEFSMDTILKVDYFEFGFRRTDLLIPEGLGVVSNVGKVTSISHPDVNVGDTWAASMDVSGLSYGFDPAWISDRDRYPTTGTYCTFTGDEVNFVTSSPPQTIEGYYTCDICNEDSTGHRFNCVSVSSYEDVRNVLSVAGCHHPGLEVDNWLDPRNIIRFIPLWQAKDTACSLKMKCHFWADVLTSNTPSLPNVVKEVSCKAATEGTKVAVGRGSALLTVGKVCGAAGIVLTTGPACLGGEFREVCDCNTRFCLGYREEYACFSDKQPPVFIYKPIPDPIIDRRANEYNVYPGDEGEAHPA